MNEQSTIAATHTPHSEGQMDRALVDYDGKTVTVRARWTNANVALLRAIEQAAFRPDSSGGEFVVRATQGNIQFLRAALSDADWTDSAREVADRLAGPAKRMQLLADEPDESVDTSSMDSYDFGDYPPRKYQLKALALALDKKSFAFTMDPRTGKTFVAIHEAMHLFERGKIDRALVVCPKSVKAVWLEELEKLTPVRFDVKVHVHSASRGAKGRDELANLARYRPQGRFVWLIVNVEALVSEQARASVLEFTANDRTYVAVDESTSIKNPSAKRTKACWAIGKRAEYRRILTGTPAPNGPFDLYSQFAFLDKPILGAKNFGEFKREYADQFGFRFKYKNLDRLRRLLQPHSYRVTQQQALPYMPASQMMPIRVRMGASQRRIYEEIRDDLISEFEGQKVSAVAAMTAVIKLRMIAGGWVKPDRTKSNEDPSPVPIPDGASKMEALLEICREHRGTWDFNGQTPHRKVVIWASFTHEIVAIVAALESEFGAGCAAPFYSAVSEAERADIRQRFQYGDLLYFVGQPGAGGLGISLWAADTTVFYSNSHNWLHRDQSKARVVDGREGRASLAYYDLISIGTVDSVILRALQSKQDVADAITGDNIVSILRQKDRED